MVFVGRFDRPVRADILRGHVTERADRWGKHGRQNAEWCSCGWPRPVICAGCGTVVCFTCGGVTETQSEIAVPCPKFERVTTW